MSKEKSIDFVTQSLEPPASIEPTDIQPKIAKQSKLERARHLDNKDQITRGGKVMSAASGKISNLGGPKKYIGSQTKNSIWDSNVIDRLKETPDSKEISTSEKSDKEHLRKSMKKERLDEMVDNLQKTDLRKDATLTNIGTFQGSNYNSPKNSISIFDSGDFERVPEKTDGEKMVEENRKPKEEDNSWKILSRAKTTKQALNSLFNQVVDTDRK